MRTATVISFPYLYFCYVARRPTGIPQEDSLTAELVESSRQLPEFETKLAEVSLFTDPSLKTAVFLHVCNKIDVAYN